MSFFSLDISKLTSNQTWQVILSTLFIAGTVWVSNVVVSNKKFEEVGVAFDTISRTMHYINVEQQFLAEDNLRIEEKLEDLGQDVSDVKNAQTRLSEHHEDDMQDVITLMKSQHIMNQEQMQFMYDDFLKKNISQRWSDSIRIPWSWPYELTASGPSTTIMYPR